MHAFHKKAGQRLLDWGFKAVEAVLAGLLLGMVLMVFGNVVLRYAFNSGIQVSEELSRFFFVCSPSSAPSSQCATVRTWAWTTW